MTNSPTAIMEKLLEILNAWKNLAPGDKFADMTVEEFEAEINKSINFRTTLTNLEQEIISTSRNRDTSDSENWGLAKLVVDSVRGSRKHGKNSPLYKGMGYILDDERASGLTRKKKQEDDEEDKKDE